MSLHNGLSNEELVEIMRAPGIRLAEVENPITRSIVRLEPPIRCTDLDALNEFESNFFQWCKALWQMGRVDPDVLVNKLGFWLADDTHTSLMKSAAQE